MKKLFQLIYPIFSLLASAIQFFVFSKNSSNISFQNQYTYSLFLSIISPFSYIFFFKINTNFYQKKNNEFIILNACFFSLILSLVGFLLFSFIFNLNLINIKTILIFIFIALYDLLNSYYIYIEKVFLIGVSKFLQCLLFYIFSTYHIYYNNNLFLIETLFYSYFVSLILLIFINKNILSKANEFYKNISFHSYINYLKSNRQTLFHSFSLMIFNSIPFILVNIIENRFGVGEGAKFSHFKQNIIIPTTTIVPIISNILLSYIVNLNTNIQKVFKNYILFILATSLIIGLILFFGIDFLYQIFFDTKWKSILPLKLYIIPVVIYHFICLPIFTFYYKFGFYSKLNIFLIFYTLINLSLYFFNYKNIEELFKDYLIIESIYFIIFFLSSFFNFNKTLSESKY